MICMREEQQAKREPGDEWSVAVAREDHPAD